MTGTLNAPLVRRRRKAQAQHQAGRSQANIRGRGDSWAVLATSSTDYGPFDADVLVRTSTRLAIDVNSGRFASMDITGRLER